jgi:N-ethylmaleimide reductase
MNLLSPYPLGPLRLPNRVVMAPMTRNRATDNLPNDLMARYYRQRASAGLVITEATQVHPRGRGYPNTPGIHSHAQVEGWQSVTDAVHDADGRIFLQLWHVGRVSHASYQPEDDPHPLAPSPVRLEDGEAFTADGNTAPFGEPRALTTDEVEAVVEQFRAGAENAKAAGFDGVEIHGANGYLIEQFLQTGTNRRTDRYGGSVENRARFLFEVLNAVTGVWDEDRVGLRISPGSSFNGMEDAAPTETFGHVLDRLGDYALAYLHVAENAPLDGEPVHRFVRPRYDGTLMVAGGYDRESGEALLRSNQADLVAYARRFLANPDLPRRFAEDAPLNDWDRSTFYGGGEEGYVDYPTLEERSSDERSSSENGSGMAGSDADRSASAA